jgi:hypothetical protein
MASRRPPAVLGHAGSLLVEPPPESNRRPHPYHSCCRAPVVEGAQVKWTGVSVAERGEPEALRPEWHADGTAGKDERGSGLAATVPARAMGEACPGEHEPRWQAPKGRAAGEGSPTSKQDWRFRCRNGLLGSPP